MAKKALKSAEKAYAACCLQCGTLITEEQKCVVDGKNYCAACVMLQKKQEPALKAPVGILKWLCYLAAFLGPLAGFVLGVVFSSQNDKTSRDFGRHCFIVVVISLALLLAFLFLSMITGVLGMGGEYTGLNLMEGYY